MEEVYRDESRPWMKEIETLDWLRLVLDQTPFRQRLIASAINEIQNMRTPMLIMASRPRFRGVLAVLTESVNNEELRKRVLEAFRSSYPRTKFGRMALVFPVFQHTSDVA